MNETGYKDKNGKEIFIGNQVLIDGNTYDVTLNDFNHEPVIDSDLGQELLSKVHMICEIIN